MAEFVGNATVIQWIYSSGTITLNTDYQTVSWSPGIDFVETSAGADTHKTRLATLKDSTASLTVLEQTGGSTLATALTAGVAGTLIIGPEGTASGKRKITMPAYSNGAQYTYTYNDKATVQCSFTGTGAFTDSTY